MDGVEPVLARVLDDAGDAGQKPRTPSPITIPMTMRMWGKMSRGLMSWSEAMVTQHPPGMT